MSWREHYEIPPDLPSEGNFKIKCKYCQTFISGNIHTTSNFSTHIKRKHRNEIYNTGKETEKNQQNLVQFMSKKVNKYGKHEQKQKDINDALVHMIAGTLSPISLVENPYFKQLINILDPRYEIPSRKQFTTKHLNRIFEEVEFKLKEILRSVDFVSLTLDLWSNRQMRGFLGITGHFIRNWKLESVMVSCKRFKGRHTSENIRQEYEETVSSFAISEKITNVVTDNAANMKKALDFSLPGFPVTTVEESDDESDSDSQSESEQPKETENIDIPEDNFPNLGHCFAHTLQLVVKDGLKHAGSLQTVIARAGKIVAFVRKSINASDILEGEKRLQSDNSTRWNSQIVMIRSVLEVPEEKLVKAGAPHKLSSYERTSLKELCMILKPFEDATIMVQKDKSVSSSLVIPLYIGLQRQLEALSLTYNNKMLITFKASLNERLGNCISDESFLMASMLDPTIKLRWCDNPESFEEKILKTARKYHKVSVQQATSEQNESPPQKKAKVENESGGLLSFMTPKKPRIRPLSGDSVKLEINKYLLEQCVEGDALEYWKVKEDNLPILASLARRFLAIPASSAPVERLFSIAGKIFRPDRCRLNDDTFHKMIMIKCNSDV